MNFDYENQARAMDYQFICGIDEAGIGPLAGDVYAAAVILPNDVYIDGLNDSKKLTHSKRLTLYEAIKANATAWSVASASAQEIDRINIRQAVALAMKRAIEGLQRQADYALVDGNYTFELPLPYQAIVKGDGKSMSIAAASILAKVARDAYMETQHETYPMYGFDRHKGYPTKAHYQALAEYGPSPIHRRSFRLL